MKFIAINLRTTGRMMLINIDNVIYIYSCSEKNSKNQYEKYTELHMLNGDRIEATQDINHIIEILKDKIK